MKYIVDEMPYPVSDCPFYIYGSITGKCEQLNGQPCAYYEYSEDYGESYHEELCPCFMSIDSYIRREQEDNE